MKTNEVLETIKARRSVREYDRKQIPADDLNAILEAGAYAPSGIDVYKRQPLTVPSWVLHCSCSRESRWIRRTRRLLPAWAVL